MAASQLAQILREWVNAYICYEARRGNNWANGERFVSKGRIHFSLIADGC